jgi:hypothetical protein
VDFLTAEVWTAGGLTAFYVLTFMRVPSREVCIAGITTSPDRRWMEQMARNMSWQPETTACQGNDRFPGESRRRFQSFAE